jgi:hypothetical protein
MLQATPHLISLAVLAREYLSPSIEYEDEGTLFVLPTFLIQKIRVRLLGVSYQQEAELLKNDPKFEELCQNIEESVPRGEFLVHVLKEQVVGNIFLKFICSSKESFLLMIFSIFLKVKNPQQNLKDLKDFQRLFQEDEDENEEAPPLLVQLNIPFTSSGYSNFYRKPAVFWEFSSAK